MKKAARIFLWILGISAVVVAAGFLFVRFAFPRVSPALEITVEVTPERLKRGEYLANHVALCIDCHSIRDFSRFGGPVKAETIGAGGEPFTRDMGFPGNIFSRNITPFKLNTWTDGEIYRCLTAGVNKDGEPLFPLMNYPAFSTMGQEDLYSIIAYIRTLQPISFEPEKTSLDFPVNMIVRTIPKDASPAAMPDTTDELAYGKYLFTIASCTECHTQSKDGTPLEGMYLAGGAKFIFPGMVIHSANITPDNKTGIGTWNKQRFIDRFKHPAQRHWAADEVGAGEFNTVMPWKSYSGMSENDLGAIYTYLRSVAPISNEVKIME